VRIDLTCLRPAVREAILEQKTPLGRVLIEHNVLRRIEPTAFLRISPGPELLKWMGLSRATTLYGRTGVIFCNDRPAIAVLEILCPADSPHVQ
jgi:chorismate-pyruvate lyase